jgi:hypothetical protein
VCWFVLARLMAFLVDLLSVRRRPDRDKDLQILLLQHQVRLLQRQRPSPRLTRWERLALAVLTDKLARMTAGPRSTLERVVFDNPIQSGGRRAAPANALGLGPSRLSVQAVSQRSATDGVFKHYGCCWETP